MIWAIYTHSGGSFKAIDLPFSRGSAQRVPLYDLFLLVSLDDGVERVEVAPAHDEVTALGLNSEPLNRVVHVEE